MPDVDLPDLTEKQLDADGDGTVTPDDIALLKSEGIPTQSIEAALDKMSARLTQPEQMDALQDLRSALASPSNAMQPGLGWALIPVLVGWLWMRRNRQPERPVERAVDPDSVRAARLARLAAAHAEAVSASADSSAELAAGSSSQ